MTLIARQPYIKVYRKRSRIRFIKEEEQREIQLFRDRIMTKYHEFPIDTVFDISFRKIGKQGGLLYIHTNKGVYSYQVIDTPQVFINQFKQLVHDKD